MTDCSLPRLQFTLSFTFCSSIYSGMEAGVERGLFGRVDFGFIRPQL